MYPQRFYLFNELVRRLVLPVHGCEPYVGHLVQFVETPQDHAADRFARYLVAGLGQLGGLVFYLVDEILYGHLGDRPLFQGADKPALYLAPLERLAPSVPLHDHEGLLLDALIAPEAEAG